MILNPLKIYRQYKRKKALRALMTVTLFCIAEMGRCQMNMIACQIALTEEATKEKTLALAKCAMNTAGAIMEARVEFFNKFNI